jgi:SAM-dependent methyltransferase
MDSVSKAVAQQYADYPYPPRENVPSWDGYIEAGDPSVFSPLLWPEGRPREYLRILVAGCGTVQAARIAIRNPRCSVFGVDISQAAIESHHTIRTERSLSNLEVHHLDLREISRLGRSFDLIFCSGVLHHLEQPEIGLQALASVLDPNGIMILMLYGHAPRVGVYLLQDAFRRLGLNQNSQSIEFVRGVISSLPQHHYFNWYRSNAPDLKSDSGIVDTLLHVRDRAYSVPQVLALVEDNGLRFQGWEDNHYYFPEGPLRPGTPLWSRIKSLPDREQWAVIENLTLQIGRHTFFVSRPERNPKRYEVDLSQPDWQDYIPMQRPGVKVVKRAELDPQKPGRYKRADFHFEISAEQAILFTQCQGTRTIAQLIEDPVIASQPPGVRHESVRIFIDQMWRSGHLLILKTPLAANSTGT